MLTRRHSFWFSRKGQRRRAAIALVGLWLPVVGGPRLGWPADAAAVEGDSVESQAAEDTAEGGNESAETPAAPEEETKAPPEVVGEKVKEVALSFGDDMRGLPRHVWQDIKALPHWKNATALALGGGLAAYSRQGPWDDDIREDVRNHPDRLGKTANDVLDVLANSYTFFGLSVAMYGTSLFAENERLHDFSLDLFSALAMELPAVFVLKKAFHTTRPNGDSDGFPSGHTAMTASFGALLNRYYGPYAGAVGALLAGVVAFHRIDSRKHDLSDVIFGAAIGYVAGRTAGDVTEIPLLKAHLVPLDSVAGARGLQLEWRF